MSSLLSGYIDRAGTLVVPRKFRFADPFKGGLARVTPFGGLTFGFIDGTGAWVVDPIASFFRSGQDGCTAFNVGGHKEDGEVVGGAWGLVGSGRVLIPASLEDVGTFAGGLLPFSDDDRWGYRDRTGAIVIPARFDMCWEMSEDGVAIVEEHGYEGYLDARGAWRLPPRYTELGSPSGGRGRIRVESGWVLTDLDGERLGEPFDDLYPFVGGLARVERDGKLALIDRNGQIVGGAWFDEIRDHDAYLAPVRRGDRWFFLDTGGRLLGPYADAQPPTEGLARYVDGRGRVGFVSSDGTPRIDPRYDRARPFACGRAAVERDGAWTFIDNVGRELHAPYWHGASVFHDDRCVVRWGSRHGVVGLDGGITVPLIFDTIDDFSGDHAAIRQVTWPQLTPPPAGWHVVPVEGLAFAGFADAGSDDDLRVTLCFSQDPDDDKALRMQQVVDMWRLVAEAQADGHPVIRDGSRWIADYAVSLRFGGCPWPTPLAQLLVEELRAVDLPIQDLVVARFQPTDDLAFTMTTGSLAVPHPRDPRGPSFHASFDDYARDAFDPNATPPASESPVHLVAGRWDDKSSSVVFDERVFSLWNPDVRICYGVTQTGFQPADERSAAIAATVTDALARRFARERVWFFPIDRDPGPPRPMTRDGAPGVEPIAVELAGVRRRGYCFALDCYALIQDIGPAIFRWREPELMEALADVVARERLQPIIMWQRFGTPVASYAGFPGSAFPMEPTVYVVNLWEP